MAIRAAEGGYVQESLHPNPTIGYLADEIGNDGSEGLQGAFFGQEIITSGKRRLGMAVAGHEVEQARHGWEMQQRRVLNDVRAGYYEVLLAQRMIDVNQQLVHTGDEGLQVTQQLLDAMEVSRADMLQARIEAESARLKLREAETRQQAAWRRLAAVLGRPDMDPAPLAGEVDQNLPDLNWDDTLARLLAQSPELAKARAGVERAKCELARQCAERVPNFEVGGAVKYDTGSQFAVADVEVGVPLPLFNRNQGNIVRAQAELVAAENEVRRAELELRDRLAAAFEQYTNARRQVQTYTETLLPNARESLDLVTQGYRAGEFGYLTLLTAQRTYFDASLSYLVSLKELWTRSVDLEGMLLSGGLGRPE
jgi:cobalt-zinc-cadmium efflux system outer membrane protein